MKEVNFFVIGLTGRDSEGVLMSFRLYNEL